MSFALMTGVASENESVAARPRVAGSRRLGRWSRPLLGLLVPLVVAIGWELVVRAGFSNGRLMPPPSVILQTLYDLAVSGELWRHSVATVLRGPPA